MFYEGGIIIKKTSWNSNPQIFQRWRDGQTGLPLVDANMRELHRQVCGSASSYVANRHPMHFWGCNCNRNCLGV